MFSDTSLALKEGTRFASSVALEVLASFNEGVTGKWDTFPLALRMSEVHKQHFLQKPGGDPWDPREDIERAIKEERELTKAQHTWCIKEGGDPEKLYKRFKDAGQLVSQQSYRKQSRRHKRLH